MVFNQLFMLDFPVTRNMKEERECHILQGLILLNSSQGSRYFFRFSENANKNIKGNPENSNLHTILKYESPNLRAHRKPQRLFHLLLALSFSSTG